MASCWKNHFGLLKKNILFTNATSLRKIYADFEPTPKKIINIIRVNPCNDAEREALGFFKRYIKGLEAIQLKKLLKFITGSDLIITEFINISFTKNDSEILRRPIAHTCEPTLELPASYNNFCELRQEFANILQETTWEMGIV